MDDAPRTLLEAVRRAADLWPDRIAWIFDLRDGPEAGLTLIEALLERGELSGEMFDTLTTRLAELPVPTVCALNGSVYGGATDMVLACDLRVGLQGLEWRMPATALGLHYYPSGLQRYVSRFGLAATKRAFLTARPFTDRQLEALGLFEALVGLEDWASTQQALVRDILALAPLAVQETKQSIREIETGHGDVGRMREREHRTSQSADFAEGRAAFAQRRTPVFTGR